MITAHYAVKFSIVNYEGLIEHLRMLFGIGIHRLQKIGGIYENTKIFFIACTTYMDVNYSSFNSLEDNDFIDMVSLWRSDFKQKSLYCKKHQYSALWTVQSITFKPDLSELWWKYQNIAGCRKPAICSVIIIHSSR